MYEPGYGNAGIMKEFAKARAKATAKSIKSKRKLKKFPLHKKYSTREEVVESRLRRGGLTSAEIKRLRGSLKGRKKK